jgi:hypothetical protein
VSNPTGKRIALLKSPRVTVLMPVRDGSKWLATAIDSVLSQTMIDLELLVIDDGSLDATPEIASKYSRAFGCFGNRAPDSLPHSIPGSPARARLWLRGSMAMMLRFASGSKSRCASWTPGLTWH